MARLTRAESQQRTREKLLDAAADTFLLEGYAAASVEQIAETAELTKGAIYSNFASKEDLFLALLERHMLREQDVWKELLDTCTTKQEVLDALAERHRCFEDKFKVMLLTTEFYMVAGRHPEVAEKFAALFRARRRDLVSLLKRLSSFDGGKKPAHMEEIATALMALGCGLALQHAADPKSVTRGTVTRVTNFFLDTLMKN